MAQPGADRVPGGRGDRRFASPEGAAGTVISGIATVAILWWSVDELVRGVNPFRRLLGGGVLVVTVVGLVAALA